MTRRRDQDDELWSQEVAYWDSLKRADLTGCLAFLHDDIVGWPNGRPAPVTKDGIFQMLVAILPTVRPGSVAIELTRRSVRAFTDFGIVWCEVQVQLRGSAGPEPIREKCVHVWTRTTDGWKIVGSMTSAVAKQGG